MGVSPYLGGIVGTLPIFVDLHGAWERVAGIGFQLCV